MFLRNMNYLTTQRPLGLPCRLLATSAAAQHSESVPSACTFSEKQTYLREETHLISLKYESAVHLSPKLCVWGDKTIKIGTLETICQKK